MNLRTVAVFMPGAPSTDRIEQAGRFLSTLVSFFERKGLTVQTRRVSFARPVLSQNGMELSSSELRFFRSLDEACETHSVDLCSLGAIRESHEIRDIARVLVETSCLYCFTEVLPVNGDVNPQTLQATADAILHIAHHSQSGLGNFRFAAGFSISPGCPFFPASFHSGPDPFFTLGTENSDLLVEAFQAAKSLTEAERTLSDNLSAAFVPLEANAREIAEKCGIAFQGIDTSMVPILEERHSYAEAFSRLGLHIGESGTLATCALVTRAIRSLPVTAIGFRGIMLPALEDFGLAAAINEGYIDIDKLLAYSSVCGVGLDMIPLAGNVTSAELMMVLRDVAALSKALSKPLVARLLPIPNGNPGDLTSLVSPYLCNTRILKIGSLAR